MKKLSFDRVKKYIFLMDHTYKINEQNKCKNCTKVFDSLYFNCNDYGYYGAVYYDQFNSEYIISHRGTEIDFSNLENFLKNTNWQSIYADFILAKGGIPKQIKIAEKFINLVAKKLDISPQNFINIGHSLGGFIAGTITILTNAQNGFVMNSPGLGSMLPALERYAKVARKSYQNKDYSNIIINFDIKGDFISHINKQIGSFYQFILEEDVSNLTILEKHDLDYIVKILQIINKKNFQSRIKLINIDDFLTLETTSFMNLIQGDIFKIIKKEIKTSDINKTMQLFSEIVDFQNKILDISFNSFLKSKTKMEYDLFMKRLSSNLNTTSQNFKSFNLKLKSYLENKINNM